MKKIFLSLVMIAGLLVSCDKTKTNEENTDTTYNVPTTYNFDNVDFSGQTVRLTMLDSISSYMKKADNGELLDATVLKNMYSNTGNPFGSVILDESGKQLKNKTFTLDQDYFDGLFDSIAVLSQYGSQIASNGVSGVKNGRLLNENGFELAQLIKKQLMGAVFYYQALETYLAELGNDDNTTVEAGKGTAMEHHTDEAFGYFGVPIDFPANLSGLKYWGGYCDEVNTVINSNTTMMNAFIKLRAAISNKDYTSRDAQIIILRENWEKVVAASAILELTEAKEAFGSDEVRMLHVLSEAVGFINSLKYSSTKKISNTEIENAVNALGTNLYDVTLDKINASINIINSIYNLDLNSF